MQSLEFAVNIIVRLNFVCALKHYADIFILPFKSDIYLNMYVKGLFYFVLFTLILHIQGRPQGESMVKSSEKLEPVSTNSIYNNTKI